ncbi:zinc ABC transporter substrate-binding protein [Vibrio sp. JC009]|uniref:metal ABC transporter solute-binding protein, Zn/Mn family n=1 Tax=Vibrio sp. JC009 TaxID=2912314 RepID=UPI0023B00FF4|nr:zinc ABC transporter substrate-binding protein [Vibrio sp. JC009]WED23839.1 zinc ABC transporter substrate-binding protein [Vibrio sp. JC009]
MNPIKKVITAILSFTLLFLFPVFATVAKAGSAKPVSVYTSILPQRYFVEKIGGERVDVQVLVSPGKSPATYEPTPQQVIDLGKADVFFSIGVPFEKAFLPTLKQTLPSLKITDTTKGIQYRSLVKKNNTKVKDPHVWLSPRLVKIQAKNIYQSLVDIDPEGKAVYQKGYDQLLKEMNDIDRILSDSLASHKGNTMFVFHPAFGYFADDYGLKQVAIETGGKEPAPAKLQQIIANAKKDNVSIVFVQPEFSQNSARAIAQAINGAVVSLSPLNPDYINNLMHIADAVKGSVR